MTFHIRMGVPEMQAWYDECCAKAVAKTLRGNDAKLFKKLGKTLLLLTQNPRHNSLQTHEIETLSRRAGTKVWQSYLENNTFSAGRIFWAYGPNQGEITIFALEPHPEDGKNSSYDRIRLSTFPPAP
jgi:hypothetical protein